MFLRCLKLLCTGRAKFTLPTPASFPPVPASSGFTPVFVLHPYTRIRSYFRFFPNPVPLLSALLLFSSFTLIPHSLLFPIFPQSCPAFSGFTPVFVLHYTRIRSCFRFSPNPVPLLPALLLLLSFIIPAFALVSDFPPILPRFFRFYSCFCPLPLYPHSLLFPIFPQSRPASSGFTPVFALYPYTRIRSCFRFFLNPAPLFPVLLLFSSFIIPAFALIDIFTPYSFFLCFERLHKQADADMPARP